MSDAKNQAKAQVESIVAMVAALNCDYDRLEELRGLKGLSHDDTAITADALEELAELEETAGDCESEEDARQRIEEDPLSIEVRSGWGNIGEKLKPEEFRILLCTGGPHVELQGDLDNYLQPSRVRVIYTNLGESCEYFPDDYERDALLTYCRQFYFGE
ncbi:MAG: hypothetical protein ACK5OQ_16240 [Burkholderiales bacterium]|jgi:hypothetical protein